MTPAARTAAAIATAAPGDVLKLQPGRHDGPVTLDKPLTLDGGGDASGNGAELVGNGTGSVITIAEKHQDAVTAISGSGPAYLFFVVESMIEAGVLLGLPRSTATELVVQTLFGAATMLRETGEHPTMLREMVSSPGGTTVAALRQLEDHKVRAAFLSAMEAAARRSKDLSDGVVDDD